MGGVAGSFDRAMEFAGGVFDGRSAGSWCSGTYCISFFDLDWRF